MSNWMKLIPVEDIYIFTDKETRNQREEVCASCPSKNGVKCGECGCFLMFLRKVQSATCPLSKW
jgi:hypothetical protein